MSLFKSASKIIWFTPSRSRFHSRWFSMVNKTVEEVIKSIAIGERGSHSNELGGENTNAGYLRGESGNNPIEEDKFFKSGAEYNLYKQREIKEQNDHLDRLFENILKSQEMTQKELKENFAKCLLYKKNPKIYKIINLFCRRFLNKYHSPQKDLDHELFMLLSLLYSFSAPSLHCLGLLYALVKETPASLQFNFINNNPVTNVEEWIKNNINTERSFIQFFLKKISSESFNRSTFDPNVLSNILIRVSLIKDPLPKQLFEYLYIMNELGFSLNIESFNSALMSLFLQKKTDDLEPFWNHMKKSELVNPYSYYTMINYYIEIGNLEKLRELETELFATQYKEVEDIEVGESPFLCLQPKNIHHEDEDIDDHLVDEEGLVPSHEIKKIIQPSSSDADMKTLQQNINYRLTKKHLMVIQLLRCYCQARQYSEMIRLFKFGLFLCRDDPRNELFRYKLVSNVLYYIGSSSELYKLSKDLLTNSSLLVHKNGLPIYASHYAHVLSIYFKFDKLALVSLFHSANPQSILSNCPAFVPTICKEYCGKAPMALKKLLMNLTLDRFKLHSLLKGKQIPPETYILQGCDIHLAVLYHYIQVNKLNLKKAGFHKLVQFLYFGKHYTSIHLLLSHWMNSEYYAINFKTCPFFIASLMLDNEWSALRLLIIHIKRSRIILPMGQADHFHLLDFLLENTVHPNSTQLTKAFLEDAMKKEKTEMIEACSKLLDQQQAKTLGKARELFMNHVFKKEDFTESFWKVVTLPKYLQEFKESWFKSYEKYLH